MRNMDKRNLEIAKMKAMAINEICEGYSDTLNSIKGTIRETKATKKLWQEENNSSLIKLGLALIAFPEPAISDIVGSILLAAGAIQNGLKRRALHVEDIPRTFQNLMRELRHTGECIY